MADKNFLTEIIDADLAEGKIREIHTRFPPEPNGYLHIGSAKAIYINWSIANQYGGKFNLRLDDTNPAREGEEYVNSIIEDLHWLGADPNGGIFYGSDYFDKCYEYAEKLIPSGIMIVSVNTGAYMAEIVRGGIISIDKGQFEGASSIGMKHSQTMFKVVIPQVMRNILPSVSNEFVINIKDTSVLNVIGVTELYSIAGVIKRTNFQTFQTYFVVCVLYFILTFTITRLLRFAEKKLDGKDNYTIFGSQTDVDAEIHIKKEAE